jgi:AraC family ethanolamine operon transcriptional activator
MSAPPPGPILLNRSFDDFDELAVAARHWDLDLRQLDQGRFDGDLLQVLAGQTMFTEARFGRTLDQRGSSPPGMRTMAIPAQSGVRFKWRRHTITDNDILIFPRNGELESISQPDFHVFILSLPESLLQEIVELADAPEMIPLLQAETVTSLPSKMKSLRQTLNGLARAAKGGAPLLANANVLRKLEYEIPSLFVEAMCCSTTSNNPLPNRRRDMAVKRAENYISQNIDEPLTVRDICRAVAVSERTLQYAFLEHFGITPKTYLRAVRLNCVRRDLRCADPDVRINEIAYRWGFWHMSQFAVDYRRQFGELPSQTVRKND